jgi:hypothetical protein
MSSKKPQVLCTCYKCKKKKRTGVTLVIVPDGDILRKKKVTNILTIMKLISWR